MKRPIKATSIETTPIKTTPTRTPHEPQPHLQRPPLYKGKSTIITIKKYRNRDLHGLSSKDSHDGVRDVGWDDVHRVDMELMEEFDVLSRAVRVPQGVIEGVFAHRLLQVFCQLLDRQWLVCSG